MTRFWKCAVLFALGCTVLAAQPVVTGVAPAQNQTDADRAADIVADFNTAMSGPAAGDIKVHGSHSGSRAGMTSGAGTTTLTHNPTNDFHAGEEVEVSFTTGLSDTASTPLGAPFVYRFWAKPVASSGTFTNEEYLTANNVTDAIATADFNGDGDIDIATAMVNGQNVVYYNDGNGSFTAANWGTGTDNVFFIRAADVTGDGLADVVCAEFTRWTIYRYDGSGLVLHASGTWSMSVCSAFSIADMDGDGDLDLVLSSRDDQAYRPTILLNDGAGNFGSPITFASNTITYWALETADLDNDGDMDVALAQQSLVQFWINDGAGGMSLASTATFGTTLQIEDIALFDIDNDGFVDCFIAAFSSSSRWALNDGSGAFPTWNTFSTTRATSLTTADFNGDGLLDLVICSRASGVTGYGTCAVYFNSGGAISTSGTVSLASGTTSAVAAADFDSDGVLDLAAATGSSFSLRKDYVMRGRIYEGTLAPGALAEPALLSSAAGTPVDVFDFVLADAGTAAGTQLLLDVVTLSVSGAMADMTWRISDGAGLNVVGSASGGQVVFSLGTWYPIPNNTAVTFTVSVEPGTSTPQTPDNHLFAISLAPNGVWLRGGGQLIPGQPTIDNGSGMTFDVAATELRVVTQPPAQAQPGTPFPVQVACTDGLGYRDLDVSGDQITLARSDAGTVSQGTTATVAQGLADFSGTNAVILGGPENLNLQLVFADDAGGSVAIAGTAASQPFVLQMDDADSLLSTGALAEPSVIDSISGAAGFISVLDFRIIDLGTSDGKPTSVSSVTIDLTGSSADAADAIWQLAGPGVNAAGSVSGTVGSQSLDFSTAISVPDGAQQTFVLSMQLNAVPTATLDEQTWTIVVRTTALTVTAGSSTSFAPGQPLVGNSTSPLAYNVQATQLIFLQQPPAEPPAGGPVIVSVVFRDAAGNVDLEVDADVVDFTRSDGGVITSASSAIASDGLVVITLTLDGEPQSIRLIATDQAGGHVDLSAAPAQSVLFSVKKNRSFKAEEEDDETCTAGQDSQVPWLLLALLTLPALVALRHRRNA